MHVSMPISKETILQGSDSVGDWTPKLQVDNNLTGLITTTSKTDADRFFAALSEGGESNNGDEKYLLRQLIWFFYR